MAIQPAFADSISDAPTSDTAYYLAECGGVFSAMSNVMADMDKTNASKTYEDTARGASLGGAYSSYLNKDIAKWEDAVKWAQNIQETRKTYWLGLMELYTPTSESVFPTKYMTALDFCTSLNPVQTELVEMMRKEIYSSE